MKNNNTEQNNNNINFSSVQIVGCGVQAVEPPVVREESLKSDAARERARQDRGADRRKVGRGPVDKFSIYTWRNTEIHRDPQIRTR